LGYTPEELKDLHVWEWEHVFSGKTLLEMIKTALFIFIDCYRILLFY